jgi:hypothetical protein
VKAVISPVIDTTKKVTCSGKHVVALHGVHCMVGPAEIAVNFAPGAQLVGDPG